MKDLNGCDLDLDELTDDFKYIINVPAMALAARVFLSNLKRNCEKEFNIYNNLRDKFREKQYGKMYVLSNSTNRIPQVYRFEIKNSIKGHWKLSTLEPDLPPGVSVNSILPPKLISFIGDYQVKRNKIYTESQTLEIDGKTETFDIQFALCFDYHIMGTVYRHGEFETEETEKAQEITELELQQWKELGFIYDLVCKSVPWDHKKHTDEENFVKMFSDMQYDPYIKKLVFENYFTRLRHKNNSHNIKLSE
jgi:hypothetical protein